MAHRSACISSVTMYLQHAGNATKFQIRNTVTQVYIYCMYTVYMCRPIATVVGLPHYSPPTPLHAATGVGVKGECSIQPNLPLV